MLGTTRRGAGAGTLSSIAIVLAGLFVAVISIYLLVNPEGLPTYFSMGYVARLVPVLFLAVVALVWPLLTLSLSLIVMFGGEALTNLTRLIFPVSPFWMLLALTLGAQMARSIQRNKAVPWGEGIVLALFALWAALYDLEQATLSADSILLPLVAGFALVVALGSLRTWGQIAFVLVAMYLAFALLVWQLLPFLMPTWGSGYSVIREQFGGLSSSLRQATTLDWLLNMMALLSLGVSVRSQGWPRMVFLALFLALAGSSILTFSRGAFLGISAGILALLLVERRSPHRRLLWIAIVVGLVAAVAYYSGAWTSNFEQRGLGREVQVFQLGQTGRLTLLWEGVKEMPSHILVGRGDVGTPAHSAIVDTWNNYGGIFAIGMMSFLFILFRRSYKMAKAPPEGASSPWESRIKLGLYCSFAGAIANSIFDPIFVSLAFSVVFWTLRGLELSIWKSQLTTIHSSGRRAPIE